MANNKVHVLTTRPLNRELLNEAKLEGIYIDELSFIETEAIQSVEVQQEIEQAYLQEAVVVFTSMNAVEAVAAEQFDQHPAWQVYCIGQTTAELVTKYFGEESIAGTANDASELAELIAEDKSIDEVIFFCGDRRRDELPSILQEHDVYVNEVVVYQTIAVHHHLEKEYHGILFFSPSAVESFFVNNKLNATTILFAIGNTTANTIRKFSTNKILVATEPGKENLVMKMIEYFGS